MNVFEQIGGLVSGGNAGYISIGLILSYFLFKSLNPKKLEKLVGLKVLEKEKKSENGFEVQSVPTDFKWDSQKPQNAYPFKDKPYKMTMGIKFIEPQDWLLMEDTYHQRIKEKTKIVTNSHPRYPKLKDLARSTVFETPEAEPALREFYDIVIKYMCDKYPMSFKITEDGKQVFNNITNEHVPAKAIDTLTCKQLMYHLVRTIEEDFIILLPDPTQKHIENGDEYFFKGGVFAFAAGFDPLDKFNKPLTALHTPIPGYESKLKVSMNRFFAKLKPGQFVKRDNFSLQTHDKFYVDDSNKGYHLTEEELRTPIAYEALDFDNQVHYRSERQVLTKLPKSDAIIFTIRTYLHPLSQFKNEPKETRQRLVGAINAFPEDMAIYKNSVQWGAAATKYLSGL